MYHTHTCILSLTSSNGEEDLQGQPCVDIHLYKNTPINSLWSTPRAMQCNKLTTTMCSLVRPQAPSPADQCAMVESKRSEIMELRTEP